MRSRCAGTARRGALLKILPGALLAGALGAAAGFAIPLPSLVSSLLAGAVCFAVLLVTRSIRSRSGTRSCGGSPRRWREQRPPRRRLRLERARHRRHRARPGQLRLVADRPLRRAPSRRRGGTPQGRARSRGHQSRARRATRAARCAAAGRGRRPRSSETAFTNRGCPPAAREARVRSPVQTTSSRGGQSPDEADSPSPVHLEDAAAALRRGRAARPGLLPCAVHRVLDLPSKSSGYGGRAGAGGGQAHAGPRPARRSRARRTSRGLKRRALLIDMAPDLLGLRRTCKLLYVGITPAEAARPQRLACSSR